jgi:hypothetical protein
MNSEGIVPTSVEELIQLPRPADMTDLSCLTPPPCPMTRC